MEKEYGQTITEYTWSTSDGSLAGDDQLEDLKINVTLDSRKMQKKKTVRSVFMILQKKLR